MNTEGIYVENIISIITVLVSIIAIIINIRETKKSKNYADNANGFNESAKKYYDLMIESIEKREEKQAEALCDAEIVKLGNRKFILKIFNKGNSVAKNIIFEFSVEEHPMILKLNETPNFPIKLLDSQKNVDFTLFIYPNTNSHSWDYEVSWENENGDKHTKNGVLTLPLS